jgi:hypothetical protein
MHMEALPALGVKWSPLQQARSTSIAVEKVKKHWKSE